MFLGLYLIITDRLNSPFLFEWENPYGSPSLATRVRCANGVGANKTGVRALTFAVYGLTKKTPYVIELSHKGVLP